MSVERSYFAYDGEDGEHVSFPLGGIGAGSIGVSASGRLIDWEIANKPDKGATNGFSHFAVRAETVDGGVHARILNGPFHGNRAGDRGAGTYREFGFGVRREYLTGLPHFPEASFEGFYPCAEIRLRDPQFPAAIDIAAFSPYIPMDETASSLPAAMFEFAVENTTDHAIRYTLAGCIGNPVKGPHGSRVVRGAGHAGMVNFARGLASDRQEFGELIIATDDSEVSWQHEWYRGSWFDSLEVYWRDLTTPGPLRDRSYDDQHIDRRLDGGGRHRGHSVLAAHRTVEPGERAVFRFVIAWYFPNFVRDWLNLYGYAAEPGDSGCTWKNHYATLWSSAEDVAAKVLAEWSSLRERTFAFRTALRRSTLPLPVLDAVSANLSTLKTPTVLRLADGTLYGWEGCDSTAGSCEGSCSHVWNYQQVTPFLFPSLERGMRSADFAYNQDPETGGMSFRLSAPLGHGRYDIRPCADGQFGNVMKAFRDWKVSGDDEWLRQIWPSVRKAVEFAWHPGNYDRWDPERTGVLHGRQHHTLDMELFGPNAWLTGFYLGALAAAARMARHLGETDLAAEYESLFAAGKAWTDANLFNGRYYYHQVDVTDACILSTYEGGPDSPVLKGSIRDLYWSEEHGEIKYQIGDGCLVDQLLAQWHADLYGIGELFDRDHAATALRSIYELNFKARLGDVVNPCRVFGLEDESGTVVCEWPSDVRRPVIPIPYSQETFHGCEYSFGSLLMAAGELGKGVRVFAAVRDRYRGHNRNPWNEMECGSNYVRSMAAYSGLLVLSGFEFDMASGRIAFAPRVQSGGRFNCFWSVGRGWGEVRFGDGEVSFDVIAGSIELTRIGLPAIPAGVSVAVDGAPLTSAVDGNDVVFDRLTLRAGTVVTIRCPDLDMGHLPDISAI